MEETKVKTTGSLSVSRCEEIISALWLIAGLLAWGNDIRWLAWCLFVKAATDTVCSIWSAVRVVQK